MAADDRYEVRYPLPDEVAVFVKELRGREHRGEITSAQTNEYLARLHEKGWVLRAIANALNGVNIEAARERVEKGKDPSNAPDVPLDGPEIPLSPSVQKRQQQEADRAERGSDAYVIPDDVAAEMRELQEIAKEVRGSTPADSPKRAASLRLAELMHQEKQNGATFVQIGEAAGVTWSAVKFRLGRYGHYKLPESMQHTAVDTSGIPV